MKRMLLAIITSSLLATPACAAEEGSNQETKLNQEQVESLLVGATVKGIHYGKETRQYFSESGLTLWIKEGDEKPSEARYKIEKGQYCSSWTGLWNEEDYGCFDIAHDKEQNVYYFLKKDFRAPFILNDGFEIDIK